MKTVYLLRHGECESNVIGAPYAGLNAKLTDKGVTDAKKLADLFSKIKLDGVISSSAPRAIHTAEFVTEQHNLPIETTDLFLERELPTELIGVAHKAKQFKSVTQKVREKFVTGSVYADEESFEQLCERAEQFKMLLEKLPGQTILVVGHGKFTKYFLAYVLFGKQLTPEIFLSLDVLKSRNLGLSELEFHDEERNWVLRQWNASFWRSS